MDLASTLSIIHDVIARRASGPERPPVNRSGVQTATRRRRSGQALSPFVRFLASSPQRPAAAVRSAFTRSDSARFVAIDAAMTPMVTIAIMMVQTALISGFTPSRTDE